MIKTEAGSEDGPNKPIKIGGVFHLWHPGPILLATKGFLGVGGLLVKASRLAWRKVKYAPQQLVVSCEPVLPPGGPAPKEQALVNERTNAILAFRCACPQRRAQHLSLMLRHPQPFKQ